MYHFNFMQVHCIASHSHPGRISAPYRHCLKPSQVSKFASHRHPLPVPPWSRSEEYYITPSMYHLTFIQVHRFSFHIHPGCVWIPSRPPRLTPHIHPGCVSPQSRSRYLHLTSNEVTSYLHPDPENCISSPPRSHLKPIPVLILTPSMLCLTYIDVQRRLVSPTSMYQLTIFSVQRLLSI